MGVPDLWDIVRPAIGQRVPLMVFANEFQARNKRSLRVAVDSYIWLFATGNVPYKNGPPDGNKIVQGFLSRIWMLIKYNISFVLVFDGQKKPIFKQNFEIGDALKLEDFKNLYHGPELVDTSVTDPEEVRFLKKILSLLNVAYVEAAGEAESECARLQNLGVVDYVISNDSDLMLFGCTKILKNFSRFYKDEQDDYYVEPVDLGAFYTLTGMDRFRMIFYSVLRGADYSSGVNKVGRERASRIAFIGTKLDKTAESCIDFHGEFMSIFYQDVFLTSLPELDTVQLRYENLLQRVREEVSLNAFEYFGRMDIVGHETVPPPYYIPILYFYPVLSSLVFKFTTGSMNYQDSDEPSECLRTDKNTIPQIHTFKLGPNGEIEFERHRGGVRGLSLDYSVKKVDFKPSEATQKLNLIKFEELIWQLDGKLPKVTNTKRYIVNNFLKCLSPQLIPKAISEDIFIRSSKLKLFPSRAEIGRQVKLDYECGSNELEKWPIQMYLFQIDPGSLLQSKIDDAALLELENSSWLSEPLIHHLGLSGYIEKFNLQLQSPKKRQSSNLETLGFLTSPKKDPELQSANKLSSKRRSVTKSPLKRAERSPKKAFKKSPTKLQPGQSSIVKFFASESNITTEKARTVNEVISLTSDEEETISYPKNCNLLSRRRASILDVDDDIGSVQGNSGVRKLFAEEISSSSDDECLENSLGQLNRLGQMRLG